MAQLVATETSHLDTDTRRGWIEQLAAAGLEGLAPKAAAGLARRLAYTADPAGAVKRARNARADRRVSLRPAPDTMAWFTALLPVEDGVRCLAALTRHTDTVKAAGDARSRSQIMADSLTERLTGQAPAQGAPVELNLTVPVEHLLDPNDSTPGEIVGHGPIPAGLVDDLLRRAGDRVTWRRLFTAPTGLGNGRMVAGRRSHRPPVHRLAGQTAETQRRRQLPRTLLRRPRSGTYDHITPYRDGGPTSYMNGRGICERHNYARELPGWSVELLANHPHITITITPTGHSYLSQAPNPP